MIYTNNSNLQVNDTYSTQIKFSKIKLYFRKSRDEEMTDILQFSSWKLFAAETITENKQLKSRVGQARPNVCMHLYYNCHM